jgi:hypothetical protein
MRITLCVVGIIVAATLVYSLAPDAVRYMKIRSM